jgi:hypothetical protein
VQIKAVYEVDPLICPKCIVTIKICDFIEDGAVIEKILHYHHIVVQETSERVIDLATPGTPAYLAFLEYLSSLNYLSIAILKRIDPFPAFKCSIYTPLAILPVFIRKT